MLRKYPLSQLIIGCSLAIISSCSAAVNPVKPKIIAAAPPPQTAPIIKHELPANMKVFIADMATKHRFDNAKLQTLFQQVELKQNIIDAMTRPAEAMPWYKYRKIFLTPPRIDSGVNFWQQHAKTLAAVEQKTGVPAQIIVAIIGVETMYGTRTGTYRVIDALSTLAFNYPKRSPFFTSELEHFLLLCREENMNPLLPTGSYAGAMGIPQFMPSSFRTYAADFEGDRKRNIWSNPNDAIASVANYFARHHWQKGQSIAIPVQTKGESYKSALSKDPKPASNVQHLKALNVQIPDRFSANTPATLLAFEQEQGEDLWLTFDNFYVITRYNHSPLYAMAVHQLSQEIVKKKNGG